MTMLNLLSRLLGGPRVDIADLLRRNAVIIDVRTPDEFRAGHVQGSINVPLSDLERELKRIKKFNRPVITCCASGRRSELAATRLCEAGLEAFNGGPWQNVDRAARPAA